MSTCFKKTYSQAGQNLTVTFAYPGNDLTAKRVRASLAGMRKNPEKVVTVEIGMATAFILDIAAH
jgi:hypothetical protein